MTTPPAADRRWIRLLVEVTRPVAPRLLLAATAGLLAAGASIGLTATSAWLISRASTRPPVLHLMVAIVAVRAFGLSRGVFRYAERLVGHDAVLRAMARLRVRVFQSLARLGPAWRRGHRSGDLVQRLVSDVDAVLDVVVRTVLPYLVATGVALGSVALVTALLPAAGLALALGLAVVAIVVPIAQSAASRRADGRLAPLRGQRATQTIDFLHGLADLTAYGMADHRLAALRSTDDHLRKATASSSATTGLGSAVTTLAGGLCVLVGLGAGAAAVRAGALDGELLAVVVLTPMAVFEAIAGLPAAGQRLAAARSALLRIAEILATPAVPDRTAGPPDHTAGPPDHTAGAPGERCEVPGAEPASPTGPTSPTGVVLTGVHAAWEPDRPALRGITLAIRPGERVAVVGESGSGKSTLAALLVRFIDPQRGSITLDGTDLCQIPPDEVRRTVRLCDEDAYLFDSTIEANLRIGLPEATPDQLRGALAAVRLLDWVDRLPEGISTAVGEHGMRLSGGQRRRLALARALLGDPPILVLDEPTEHLDEATADAVMADILEATAGRTLVLITHRLAGLDALDRIVTLAHGTVQQDATSLPGPRALSLSGFDRTE